MWKPHVHLDGITLGYDAVPVYTEATRPPHVDQRGVEWILTSLSGWEGSPAPRTRRVEKPNSMGSFRTASHRSERIVSIEGTATAPSHDSALISAVKRQIAGVCADGRRSYRLVVDEEPQPLAADVELDGEILVQPRTPFSVTFSLQLAAADPRLKSATWNELSTGMAKPGSGGLDFTDGLDFTGGLDFGEPESTGIATVSNSGTAYTAPLLLITGPVDRPRITGLHTGVVLDYVGSLSAGQYLVINTDVFPAQGYPARCVLLNGTESRRLNLDTPFGWPRIEPGEFESFRFEAQATNDTALLTVRSPDCWM